MKYIFIDIFIHFIYLFIFFYSFYLFMLERGNGSEGLREKGEGKVGGR